MAYEATKGTPQSPNDVRATFSILRGVVEHEDNLVNHRFTWLLVIEGLLITAAVAGNLKAVPIVLVPLAVVGVVLPFLFDQTKRAAYDSMDSCEDKWKAYVSSNGIAVQTYGLPNLTFKTKGLRDYAVVIWWVGCVIIPLVWGALALISFSPSLIT